MHFNDLIHHSNIASNGFFIWVHGEFVFNYIKRSIFFIFVPQQLSYINFINWLFSWLNLYVVSLRFNKYSWYVIGCFTRSDPFVWLWNDYYFISSSLIDCLLALICMLFLIICIIVASMFLAVLQEVISLHILFCLLILDLLRYMLLLIYMNHHSWYV